MQHLASIHLRLAALSVFRGLRRDPVVSALEKLLDCEETSPSRRMKRYAQFAGLVLEAGGNWTRYLFSRTLKDDNEYVRRLAAGKEIPTSLERTLEAELESLQLIGSLTPGDLMPAGIDFPVAGWETQDIDFVAGYRRQMNDIRRRGYGIFADSHMFVLKGEELQPILCPDPVDFDQLVGYEQEREAVTANTWRCWKGAPAPMCSCTATAERENPPASRPSSTSCTLRGCGSSNCERTSWSTSPPWWSGSATTP